MTKITLLLVISVVVVSIVYAISIDKIVPLIPNDERSLYCPTQELNHWNAIIFNRFQVNKNKNLRINKGIDGALMVGLNSFIHNYKINRIKETIECGSSFDEFIPMKAFGLYAHASSYLDRVDVKGAIIHPHRQQINNQITSDTATFDNCRIKTEKVEEMDLISAYEPLARGVSTQFAKQKATLVLLKNGSILPTGIIHPEFHFIGFAPTLCLGKDKSCEPIKSNKANASDPLFVFYESNTKVIINWPTDKPIVFNIPVVENTVIRINAKHDPMKILPACQTIWNFYTVDRQERIFNSKNHGFTIERTTSYRLRGVFLAIDGTIRDGPEGGFEGQLVAHNYEWLDNTKNHGVSIYGFNTTLCKDACWPRKITTSLS